MSYSRKKTAYWQGILAQYAASGLRPIDFCRARGLAEKSFYKWRLRLRPELATRSPVPSGDARTQERLELLPVATQEGVFAPPRRPSAEGGSGVSIQAGMLLIRVDAGFDEETLRRVLDVTGGRPC